MGRDKRLEAFTVRFIISIHAPHMGRDVSLKAEDVGALPFQSTRPMRGATSRNCKMSQYVTHFNPRAPYGARLPEKGLASVDYVFQSTRPIWGATPVSRYELSLVQISIHAPHMGRDNGLNKM